jgi:hypothetical protein
MEIKKEVDIINNVILESRVTEFTKKYMGDNICLYFPELDDLNTFLNLLEGVDKNSFDYITMLKYYYENKVYYVPKTKNYIISEKYARENFKIVTFYKEHADNYTNVMDWNNRSTKKFYIKKGLVRYRYTIKEDDVIYMTERNAYSLLERLSKR